MELPDDTNFGVNDFGDHELTPAQQWLERDSRGALDELFASAQQFRRSDSYRELIHFIVQFRFYSPFNAILIKTQMPGARYVATGKRWWSDYQRRIRPNAQAIAILQPMGPIMFVFDVSDTEATPQSRQLPGEIINPFSIRNGCINKELDRLIENSKRDGVRILPRKEGSQSAGSITRINPTNTQSAYSGTDGKTKQRIYEPIPICYEVLYNGMFNTEVAYATIVHELAHLYCGHLGTSNSKYWPDRRGLPKNVREFEAESVCFLTCRRMGIETTSEEYLSGYLESQQEIPEISFDVVIKAVTLIEEMSKELLKIRKPK